MNIEFLGRLIRVQSGYATTFFQLSELFELMAWAKEHEIEIAATAREIDREQEQPKQTRLLTDSQPQYFLGDD